MLAAFAVHAPSGAAAQVCDEDAGDEDAGEDGDAGLVCEPADAGMPPFGTPDASLPDGGGLVDAGGDASDACSCETVENTGAGSIHVCTGARERYECRYLECNTTHKRDRPCPTRGVELCCEMPSRGLYSQLYEDCDHPNCQTGFRAQCRDFGGTIREGACLIEEPGSESDDPGGSCSAAARTRSPLWSGAIGWLVAIALAARVRLRSRS